MTRSARPALVGLALGFLLFGAGSILLYEAGGVLPAAGGFVATLVASLAAGLWAGTPGAAEGRPRMAHWLFAGGAMAAAGVFAMLWALFIGERGGAPARAAALLFLVGLPAYAIGLLLPPLAVGETVTADGEAVEASEVGRTLVWVLLGIAAASVAAGLFLLPALHPGPLLLGGAALLTLPLVFPAPESADTSEEAILHESESPFGTLRVTEIRFGGSRQPELRLYQNDEIESGELVRSGAPTHAYIAAAERWFTEVAKPGDRYLFLGGGAYTLPRRMAERDPSANITVVELDPEVTRVAYRFFGLRPEHGIASLHGDARATLERLPDAEYDRIFVDVYDGTESIPYSLVTTEAFSSLSRLLRPGGTLAVNVIGVADGEGERRFWTTVRTAAGALPSVALYHHLGRDYPERQNFLLVGATVAEAQLPKTAGTFETWPQTEWPAVDGSAVFRDVYPAIGEKIAAAPRTEAAVDRV